MAVMLGIVHMIAAAILTMIVSATVQPHRPAVCAIGADHGYCVVTKSTPCPQNPWDADRRWGCAVIDLRIDVRPGQVPQQGLFVRFIVPTTPGELSNDALHVLAVPALAQFPGTGTYVRKQSPPRLDQPTPLHGVTEAPRH